VRHLVDDVLICTQKSIITNQIMPEVCWSTLDRDGHAIYCYACSSKYFQPLHLSSPHVFTDGAEMYQVLVGIKTCELEDSD
jgi:hypothetical protein